MTTETPATGASEASGTTVLTVATETPASTTTETATADTVVASTETTATTETKPEGEAKDGDKGDEKPTGAPEEYAPFELPEGFAADGPVMDSFKATAKELNLPQDAAQKVVALGAQLVQQTQQQMRDAWTATQEQWVNTIKTDAEIGGAQMNERVAVAVKALDRFGSPELRKALNETGMGNHPEVVRAFYRIGLAISEDTLVTSTTKAAGNKDAADILYGSNG
jgi:hypothetical protein